MKLTSIQQSIVESNHRNVLVSAGAGTGKTRVLVERYLRLLTQHHARVAEILALTFTDKAASEMKSRVRERLGELGVDAAGQDLESAYIMTFHSFASRLLKEHPLEAAIDPDFSVIESEEADFLKEQALDATFEQSCREEPEIFDLLKTHGEEEIRRGILKVLGAAAAEGRRLKDYFESQKSCKKLPETHKISPLLEQLGESQLFQEWLRFSKAEKRDWEWMEALKTWASPFSRRGGKKDKPIWKELCELIKLTIAEWVDQLRAPEQATFERLALRFSETYTALKKEKAQVDFHDLELKLLELFEKKRKANQRICQRYQRQFRFIMVDEFQDTNSIQAKMVDLLSSDSNLFFVGDYKQSIYGFRGTSPFYFLQKEKEYQAARTSIRFALNENFRSEPRVLAFINQYFDQLWKGSGLSFEPLIAKTEAKGISLDGVKAVEIWNVQIEGESIAHGRMKEAEAIAKKIRRLYEDGVPFGDMVLLFQAMTASPIYEQALKQEGIPFFAVSGRGYYHQLEIKDMMSLLTCLDNPTRDIPLAAVLRSPIFQISDDTLVWLSQEAKKEDKLAPFYHGFLKFEGIASIPETEKTKLRFAKLVLEEFRQKKDRLRIAELLERLMEKTSYLTTVLADPQGVRRYANLKKLVDLAREYESHEVVSLSDFVRAIRSSSQEEIRESEAQIEAEKSGKVVRLMTVHKAKGLEFPVVFVADLAHANQTFQSKTFLAEPGAGYSFLTFNPKSRDWEKPLSWIRIDEAIKLREKEERKRLFYVAMTRAKSFLVLSGVTKVTQSEKKSINEMNTWMEWTLELEKDLKDSALFLQLASNCLPKRNFVPAEKKIFQRLLHEMEPQPLSELIAEPDQEKRAIEKTESILNQLKASENKPARAIDLPVSAYVEFVKNPQSYWETYELGMKRSQEPILEFPESAQDLGLILSAADFGTRMHQVLERVNFHDPEESGSRLIAAIFKGTEKKEIEDAGNILAGFVQSPIFREVQKAKHIYRELPFILNERHGRIHGVIDLLYEDEKGSWQVLDYKTMAESREKIEQTGYEDQMMIYALAVRRLLKKVPAQALLYFLKSQSVYAKSVSDQDLIIFQDRLRKMQESLLGLELRQSSTTFGRG